jgi:hypothetical protein
MQKAFLHEVGKTKAAPGITSLSPNSSTPPRVEIQVLLSHKHARLMAVPLLLDMTSSRVSCATGTAAAATSAVAAFFYERGIS